MVKITRSYTIEEENVRKLSDVSNSSGLINKLLTEHFDDTTSTNPEVLEAQKIEIELEQDIMMKRLNHIKDKLRILKQKELEDISDSDYQKILLLYDDKVSSLNYRYQNKEFDTGELDDEGNDKGDAEYWRLLDELKEQKPLKKVGFEEPPKVPDAIEELTQEENYDAWENRELDLTEHRKVIDGNE